MKADWRRRTRPVPLSSPRPGSQSLPRRLRPHTGSGLFFKWERRRHASRPVWRGPSCRTPRGTRGWIGRGCRPRHARVRQWPRASGRSVRGALKPGKRQRCPRGWGAARPGAWAPRTDRRFSLAARGPAHDLPAGPADRVRDAPGAFLHGGFAAAPRCEQGVLLNKIKGLCKADVVYGGT